MKGSIEKMKVGLTDPVEYQLNVGDEMLTMNDVIGKNIKLHYQGDIHCIVCERKTNKSFGQGYCYPCFRDLARCDLCIMKPETCHYDAGTCREPEWGDTFCMQDHIVYLANSSGIKVGITRINQVPTRWIDQGAIQALPIFRVKTRYQSGLVEVIFKAHVSDRTDWRKMLKGQSEPVDLLEKLNFLMAECQIEIAALQQRFGEEAIVPLLDESVVDIEYPVQQYPDKVKSHNFDKTPLVSGVLQGIKGQYLILDTCVLNIRKFSGYHIKMVIE